MIKLCEYTKLTWERTSTAYKTQITLDCSKLSDSWLQFAAFLLSFVVRLWTFLLAWRRTAFKCALFQSMFWWNDLLEIHFIDENRFVFFFYCKQKPLVHSFCVAMMLQTICVYLFANRTRLLNVLEIDFATRISVTYSKCTWYWCANANRFNRWISI